MILRILEMIAIFSLSFFLSSSYLKAENNQDENSQLFKSYVRTVQERLPSHLKDCRVAIGEFSIENDDIPSPLTLYIHAHLIAAFSQYTTLKVIPSDEIKNIIENQSPLLSTNSLVTTRGLIDVLDADLYISGSCWDKVDHVEVWLNVYEKEVGRILSNSINIFKTTLFSPNNYMSVAKLIPFLSDSSREKSSTIQVELWVNHVNKSYHAGEKIFIYLKTDMPAYLSLFYLDANGKTVQLFPNKYTDNDHIEANKVIILGDKDDPFDFIITQPFGIEVIKAYRCSEKFPDFSISDYLDDKSNILEKIQRNFNNMRDENILNKNIYFGEATCSIITVQ